MPLAFCTFKAVSQGVGVVRFGERGWVLSLSEAQARQSCLAAPLLHSGAGSTKADSLKPLELLHMAGLGLWREVYTQLGEWER